jgi:hypothetical protein
MKWLFKQEGKHLAFEVLLILASVLIFRSAWLLLDNFPYFHRTPVLIIMLIAGVITTVFIFEALFKHERDHP